MTGRPRPKAPLAVDVHNPYARLGVSPLASIDEIKRVAGDRRGKGMAQARGGGPAAAADAHARILEIQDIERQIGTPAARAAYDREHPQNALLTVQPGPRDRGFGPAGATSLVTAWLADELGPDALLVHPDALWLWLPAGLDPELARELAQFYLGGDPESAAESARSPITHLESGAVSAAQSRAGMEESWLSITR
jgi:hypothetical protein